MKGNVIAKVKRPLSLAMAVLLTVTAMPSIPAYAEDSDTDVPKQYEVTMPVYGGCTYVYDSTHLKTNAEDKIVLEYEKDEKVQLQVSTSENVTIEGVHVSASGKGISFDWSDNYDLAFKMPGQDVTIALDVADHTDEILAQSEAARQESEEQSEEARQESEAQSEAARQESEVQSEKARQESEAQSEEARQESEAQSEAARQESEAQSEAARQESEMQTEAAQLESEDQEQVSAGEEYSDSESQIQDDTDDIQLEPTETETQIQTSESESKLEETDSETETLTTESEGQMEQSEADTKVSEIEMPMEQNETEQQLSNNESKEKTEQTEVETTDQLSEMEKQPEQNGTVSQDGENENQVEQNEIVSQVDESETQPEQNGTVLQVGEDEIQSEQNNPWFGEEETPSDQVESDTQMTEETYQEELDADEYPKQGSLVQVDTLVIPYDTWDFNPAVDLTNIHYNTDEFDITYISDDINYTTPGIYSTIYRVCARAATERMWFVLRPVRVAEKGEVRESETETTPDAEKQEEEETEESDDPDPAAEPETEETILDTYEVDETEESATTLIVTSSNGEEESTLISENDTSEAAFDLELLKSDRNSQAERLVLALNDPSFDAETDFRNLEAFIEEGYSLELVFSDVDLEKEGSYSTVYQMTNGDFTSHILRQVDVFSEDDAEEEQKKYAVYLADNSDVDVILESDYYLAGEEVQLTVSAASDDTEVYGVIANTADGEIECEYDEKSSAENLLVYSFEMPEEDVVIGVESESIMLVDTIEASASSDEPKLTSVYFERGGSSFYASAIATGGGENMKHVIYKYSDGTNVEVVAYCLQNRVHGSPVTGYYSSQLHELDASGGKEKRLRKALFYCYGGPGWGKTFSGINIQKVMKSYGLSSANDFYYATHNITSYIYSGKYSSYLNKNGINLIKEILNDLDELPDPSICELTRETLTASNGSTDSIRYRAATENTATLNLPSGVTLVNEDTGESYTGTVSIPGWTTFHLESSDNSKLVGTYTLTTKFGSEFEAYAIQVSGVQDIGFAAGSTSAGSLSFQVVNGGSTATVRVTKKSDDPNNWLKKYPDLYSVEDVEYTFYSNADQTGKLGKVTTNAKGVSNTLKIDLGTADQMTVYYVETTKAAGHSQDYEVHSIVLEATHNEVYEIEAVNHVAYVVIDGAIVKKNESGETLADAWIKVHFYGSDATYTNEVTNWVFKTGSDGKMIVSNADKISGPTIATTSKGVEIFPIGYYAFEEVKAPDDYVLDDDSDNIVYKKAKYSKIDGKFDYTKITLSSTDMINQSEDLWKIRVKKVSTDPAITDDNDNYTLKGAVFGFYDENGTCLATKTTDENGYTDYVELTGLPADTTSVTITVKEEKAPKGFVLNETPKTVTLTKKNPSKTAKFSDEPIFTELYIKKVTTTDVPGISLADCIFGIFSDESCEDQYLVQKMRTLEDGCTDTIELDYGSYWIKELECPDTFELNTEIKAVKLTKARDTAVEVKFANVPVTYPLSVKKVSANSTVTTGNSCYSFKGAKFNVATDSKMENVIATLEVKDETGISESVELTKGTYYVQEVSAPKGYKLNTKIYPVKVTSKAASVEIEDEPVTGLAGKLLTKYTDARTSASLAGAEFEVKFYGSTKASGTPLRTWILKTVKDKQGNYVLQFDKANFVSGDSFYTNSAGEYVLPLGCITFQETKAPAGFRLNTKIYKNTITEDGTAGDETVIYNVPEVPNSPAYGGVKLDKTCADFGQTAEGDASFKNAVFSILSLNDYTVSRSDQAGKEYAKNEEVATITTDKDGIAQIGTVLQAGTYRILEKTAPEGYQLSKQTVDFTITTDGEIVDLTGTPFADEVIRGGFTIQKLDADTKTNVPQGDADLSGAVFTVTNKSAGNVKVNGKTYKPGQVVLTLKTDKDGYAETGKNVLPYGTYEVKETVPPSGYQLDTTVYPVTITTEGQYDQLGYEYKDPVIRGGIKINKYDIEVNVTGSKQGDASLEGAVFTVTNQSEHSVIVDGKTYAKGEVVATLTTDASGTASTLASSLPYGTYTVTETKAPYGYLLTGENISKTIQIRENGTIVTDDVKEDVVRGGVKIAKWDQELGQAQAAQGDATLAGAEFTLTNVSAETVYVDADGDGTREAYASGQTITVLTTDENGEVATADDYLPCGTYHVKETKQPEGYTQKGENLEWEFSVGGTAKENGTIYDHTTVSTAVKNVPIHFDVELTKFRDTPTSEDPTDRVVSLEGIEFTITNVSANEVFVNGKNYQPGEVVMTIVTDENGFATTAGQENCETGALPYGRYQVHEVNCPEGLTAIQDFVVEGTTDGGVYDGKTYQGIYLNDIPVESRIRIRKVDEETGSVIPQGATFQILDENKNVMEFLVTYPTTYRITEFTTDEDGIIETPTKLPYGTYYLREIDPPYDRDGLSNGYVTGSDLEFHVDENHAWEDVIEVTYSDVPSKGDITVTKLDADTQETIAGAVFAVFADADIVTGDGTVRYKKGEQVDVFTTGEDGTGTSSPLYLGSYHVQEIKAPRGYCLDTEVYPFTLTYDEAHKDMEVSHDAMDHAVANKPTTLQISKIDIDGLALDGITFELERVGGETDSGIANELASDGGTFVTADGGMLEVKYLVSGIYSLTETETLPGYVLDDTVRYVTVDANGFIYESDAKGQNKNADGAKSDTVSLSWTNDYTKWDFSKTDVTGDEELPGAELAIYDADGMLVEQWISTEEKHRVNKLPLGEYTLVEQTAPEGFVTASAISFEVTNTGAIQQAAMTDKQVIVHKTDITGEQEIPGAALTVTDQESGEVADQWISTEETHPVSGLQVGHTYILHEETAPEGYVIANDIEFYVADDGQIQEVVMIDKQVLSLKVDTLIRQITGAHLQVTDASGTVTDDWISDGTPHAVSGLKIGGTYTLTELAAPEGYVLASPVTFTVTEDAENDTFSLVNKQVRICKTDVTGDGEIPGAALAVYDLDGNMVDTWVSDGSAHAVSNVAVGESYFLREENAPAGYVTASEIPFIVADDGVDQEIFMQDDVTKVMISKQDITTGGELPGATLEILDTDGTVVETWVSGTQPHYIEMLPVGTYTLKETAAPAGYITSEDVVFEVADTGEVQKVEMTDDISKICVTKTDLTGSNAVIGAELIIRDQEGKELYRWVTEEEPYYIEMLPVGTYTLTEVSAPSGYATAETVQFEVTDTSEVQAVNMKDDVTKVEITKTDLTDGNPVIGAELVLKDMQGNEIDRWITGEEPHYIEMLPVGTYTLTEMQTPDGYTTAETITFEVADTAQIQHVDMDDDITKVVITKTDLTNGEPVIGAELSITDQDGNEVERWTTGEKTHYIEKLPAGDYTLTEVTAPDGYVTAEAVSFTVEDTGEIQKINMDDDVTKVEITKSDITDGTPVIGAELVINDRDGNEIDRWITEETAHYIEKLPVGDYTLTELTAPDGYVTAETVSFTVEDTGEIQKVNMDDDITKVEITKSDITDGTPVIGAELVINDRDGNEIDRWITEETAHYIEKLPVGDYTLTEITAPDGYATAETVPFTVEDTGEIQQVDMKDAKLQIVISKRDITNDEELPGAKLTVKDENGETIDEWISEKEPHLMNLKQGTYTLTEVTAPEGYEVAESIEFTVEDTAEVQTVKMYDSPKEATVDLTGKTDQTTIPSFTTVTTSPVRTGDYNRYLPALVLVLLGIATGMILFATRKRKKQ